jgi:ankyrin repeat protein
MPNWLDEKMFLPMNFDDLQKLIKNGEGTSANLSNQFSWTLLMLAVIEGNLPMAELLISRGADVNAVNDFGATALSLAACAGHIRLVRVLLGNGSFTDCEPHGQRLEIWLKVSSGLPQDKIASIIEIIVGAIRKISFAWMSISVAWPESSDIEG